MIETIGWFYLFFAIITEVAGITSMKLSHGFSRLEPSLLIFFFYALSLTFLMLSLKRLEIGLAYAIWSGLGTLLIFIIGIVFFHEPITTWKTISLACIILGVLGLRRV